MASELAGHTLGAEALMCTAGCCLCGGGRECAGVQCAATCVYRARAALQLPHLGSSLRWCHCCALQCVEQQCRFWWKERCLGR
jgi:hypothetical protein